MGTGSNDGRLRKLSRWDHADAFCERNDAGGHRGQDGGPLNCPSREAGTRVWTSERVGG
eukprot:COSAG05_NODE_454_length_9643_cov_5.989627_9_plen_59_part_00